MGICPVMFLVIIMLMSSLTPAALAAPQCQGGTEVQPNIVIFTPPSIFNGIGSSLQGCADFVSGTTVCGINNVAITDGSTGPTAPNLTRTSDVQMFLTWQRQASEDFLIVLTNLPQMSPFSSIELYFLSYPMQRIGLPGIQLVGTPHRNSLITTGGSSMDYTFSEPFIPQENTINKVTLFILSNPGPHASLHLRMSFTGVDNVDWFFLSEVNICTGTPTPPPLPAIQFQSPTDGERVGQYTPNDFTNSVVLNCTVLVAGVFQWQWKRNNAILMTGGSYLITTADGTRTSRLNISQLRSTDAGNYTCEVRHQSQSSYQSRTVELVLELLVSSPTTTATIGDQSANLSCELYSYLTTQPPTITWNFGNDVLMNGSVFTITVQDGSHMIQNRGNTPRPSMRSVLTINRPNRTHEGSYTCSSGLRTVTLQVSLLPIAFLQPNSMEPPVPPGPDNLVSAANLSCTVVNKGSFQWQWTPPPGITLSQMWVADRTRTSVVQISQISAANSGEYTCRASFNGHSANTSIAVQLNQMLVPSPNMTATLGNPFVTLSCELYGYLMRQPPTITWNFGSDVLMNDTVFTITVQDGSHQIQNGGDTPRPSMRSVLTINHPNRTHEGSYNCSVSGISDAISLQVMKVIVNVKVVNATALLVSWSAVRNIQRYTIYYSAFSPVLYKVVDKLTIVVPSTKTSDIVVIRELTAGVEHQFQVAAEMGEKSKLTSVVFDELPFHLQMGPVSPCTAWNVEKTNLIRSYVHSGISEAISDRCNCTFQVDFIRKGTFYCWNSLNEVTYRSMIVGTATHRATQLLQFLEEWVNSEPALLVDQFGLWVGAKCPVRISSLSDPQCPGLTPPAGDPTLITRDPAVIQCVNACMYRLRGERFCT